MSVFDYLMYISHTLTGPGLFALLSMSRVSHESSYLLAVIGVSYIIGSALSYFKPVNYELWDRQPGRQRKFSSLFVYIINNSFNLIITIAVLLNVASQIFPDKGRELALIPVYVLLCCSRLCPSETTYAVQGIATVLFALDTFLFTHSSKHARAQTDESIQSSSPQFLAIFDVFLTHVYACTQLHSGVFYASREWERPKWVWNAAQAKWYLNSQWAPLLLANLSRCIFLALVLVSKEAVIYHFLVSKSEGVNHYALVGYGGLLLLGCMLLGSSWFLCLKDLGEDILGKNISGKKTVRLQHILYVIIVAGAYIFPLQMVELRLGLTAILLMINFV